MTMSEHSLVDKAARIAVEAHVNQKRKGDGSPYVVHPFMVAYKLTRHGFSETIVAAALVHDVLEDTDVGEERLRDMLGEEVVCIVKAVSEDKTLVWEDRKEKYLEMVRESSPEVWAVSCADKIHNLESILAVHAASGDEVWGKFKRGKEQKLALEEKTLALFKELWQHPLVNEYEQLVTRLREVVH